LVNNLLKYKLLWRQQNLLFFFTNFLLTFTLFSTKVWDVSCTIGYNCKDKGKVKVALICQLRQRHN